ncbi:MAG: DUF2807 domain-containing protein [Mucilaginibacter sp.]
MKTSNKLLILVTAIILIFLVIYDNGLKAEYVKGAFRSRFFRMEQLSFKDFSNIKHNSADKVGIRVEKGDKYQVWIKSDLKDKLTITQQGKTLTIKMNGQNGTRIWGYQDGIIIICPQIDSLTTLTDADASNRKVDYKYADYNNANFIIGFHQTKMVINQNRVTGVELIGNQIDDLQATVGDKLTGKAYLNINANNGIKQANIQVPGKSEFKLSNAHIGKLNYVIADSAKVTLSGKSLSLIK